MKRFALLFAVLVLVGCGGTGPDGTGGGSGGGTGGASGGTGGSGGGAAGCSATNCTGCCLNGTCNAGSTNAGCGKSGAACVACVTGQVCKADQTCGIDPNSMWKVQPSSATVRSTDSTGVAWDAFGGAPDPFCSLWCPATATTVTSSTPSVTDSFAPTWTTGGCVMKASDLLTVGFDIAVYDEDVSSNDTIAGAGTITVTEAQLLAGHVDGITNNSTLVTLSVSLTKQ